VMAQQWGASFSFIGGFVDGSGWRGVYDELKKTAYTVSVVQNPTLSLEDDATATRRIIDAQSEPVILRGPLLRRSGDHRGGPWIPTWRRSSTSRPSCRTRVSR